jgi:ABC-2 type transport system permease protein
VQTLNIARRQFASYFNSPAAYIVLALTLAVTGFLFFVFPGAFFLAGRATLRTLFSMMPWALLFACPALTMGLLAEERRTGTIELLITMPVRDWEVIVGKYLASLGLLAVLLAFTLPYPIVVASFGPLDWGPVWTGYLGLFLEGAALLAIGVMTSSWTENQLIAFFVAFIIGFLLVILGYAAQLLGPGLGRFVEAISFGSHFESMARGVLDTRDLVFFVSLIVLPLAIAFRSLESRRWR